MKKFTLAGFALLAVYVLLTAFVNVSPPIADDAKEAPNLPATPYSYAIDYPDHFANNPNLVAAANELSDDVATLGRVLFYDTKLSKDGVNSCQNCHLNDNMFASDKPFSTGVTGVPTKRNVPALNGLMIKPVDHFFWDMRESDLKEVVIAPIEHIDELGSDMKTVIKKLSHTDYYPELFANAFGSTEITTPKIQRALSQFVSSIISFQSKYDQSQIPGSGIALNAIESEGLQLVAANCGDCHFTSNGANNQLSNGLDSDTSNDQGLGSITGKAEHMGVFRQSSLRNIAMTAPYMHDGRFETLDEVIEFYSSGLQDHPNSKYTQEHGYGFTGLNFTAQEKAAIKAFLHTLTDESIAYNVKWSNPFDALSPKLTASETTFSVTPNPSDGAFRITFDNAKAESAYVRVYSLEGRLMKVGTTDSNTFEVIEQNWPKGMYVVSVQLGETIWTEQLMIQ